MTTKHFNKKLIVFAIFWRNVFPKVVISSTMASSRWFGLDAALENLLNEEYFNESETESDEDGIQQGEDDDRQEQEYDNEADILARVNSNDNNPAQQQQQHPLVINHGGGGDGVASVQATSASTNAATEGSSATSVFESTDNNGTLIKKNALQKSFCCTADAVASFAEDAGNIDTLRTTLQHQMAGDCGCATKTCWQQFSLDEVYSHILTMRDMSKGEKEAYIMGKLQASRHPIDTVQHARKKRKGELLQVCLYFLVVFLPRKLENGKQTTFYYSALIYFFVYFIVLCIMFHLFHFFYSC